MTVDEFIARWTAREGGAERANYQMFLSELCDGDRRRPDPAPGADRGRNRDYVFERAVSPRESADTTAPRRIDLYKKGAFILEAKQSRLPGGRNAMPNQLSLFTPDDGAAAAASPRGWDAMMQNARKQAENYVFLLDPGQPTPPFVIVCDVGRCLELYADFSGTGRAYSQFPDRTGFQISMDGHVRWLRPDYQIPRFGKGAAAKTGELAFLETITLSDSGLPPFPRDRYEQPLAVEALLASAGRPLAVAEAARGFKRGGKRIEPKVAQALATLARYGRISALPDGRFAARKVA